MKTRFILVLPCLFDSMDSKVEYRFPLSFKWERIYISGRFLARNFEFLFWIEGAQQKRWKDFNQSLARYWDLNT